MQAAVGRLLQDRAGGGALAGRGQGDTAGRTRRSSSSARRSAFAMRRHSIVSMSPSGGMDGVGRRREGTMGFPGATPVALEALIQHHLLEEEVPWYVILGDSRWKPYWDLLVSLLVLYTCFALPLRLGFKLRMSGAAAAVDYFSDVLFLVDLGLNFITAYELPSGEEVTDVKLIKRRYFQSWFALDLVAAIPFEAVVLFTDMKSVTALNLLKAPRLLRVTRIGKVLNKSSGANHFRILKLLVFFFMFSHWTACAWYYLGRYQQYGNVWTGSVWLVDSNLCQSHLGSTGEPFIHMGLEHCLPDNHHELLEPGQETIYRTVEPEAPSGRSLFGESAEREHGEWSSVVHSDADFNTRYLTSLYWAFTTLTSVGYGDIVPHTNGEKIFAMWVMIFGAVVYATIFGNVALIIQSFDAEQMRLKERTDAVIELAGYYNLSPLTVDRLHGYNEVQKEPGGDFRDLLLELPTSVSQEISLEMYSELAERMKSHCPTVFKHEAFISALLLRMQPRVVMEGDSMQLMNVAKNRAIHIMNSGILELHINTRSDAPKLMEELMVQRKASLSRAPARSRRESTKWREARTADSHKASKLDSAGTIMVNPGEFFCGFHNALPNHIKDVDTNFVGVARITSDMYLLRQGDIIEIEREFASELYKLRQYFFMRVQPMCGTTMTYRKEKDSGRPPDATEPSDGTGMGARALDGRLSRLEESLGKSLGNNNRRLSAIESRLEVLLSALGGGPGCVMPEKGDSP